MSFLLTCIQLQWKQKIIQKNIILALVSYFVQYGHDIKSEHSHHETALISATTLLNQQGIQYQTMAPYQHEQKLERYVLIINARFRSVLSSLKFKLPNKLYTIIYSNPTIHKYNVSFGASHLNSINHLQGPQVRYQYSSLQDFPYASLRQESLRQVWDSYRTWSFSPTLPLITLLLGFKAEILLQQ